MFPRPKLQKQAVMTQTQEDYLHTILRHVRGYLVVLDLEGVIIDVIETWSPITSIPKEKQIGVPLWQVGWWNGLLHEQEQIKGEIARAAKGHPIRGSACYHTVEGEERYSSYILNPIIDEQGMVTQIAYQAFDITEQKRKEEELCHIFEMSLDIISVIDMEGHYIQVNPAFEKLLGYKPEDVIGRDSLDYVHPDDIKIKRTEIKRLQCGEVIQASENRYRTKDGTYRWIAWSARPNLDEGVIYIVAHDIDEQKAQEQLRDTFLSMASHELRTPLTGISTSLQMMRKRLKLLTPEEPEKFIEITDRLQKNLERAEQQVTAECRIINDIVDANRIARGQLAINPLPLDLICIVRQVIGDAQITNPERCFELTFPAEPYIPVIVDAMRISQVLDNILANAIKYSPDDQPVKINVEVNAKHVKVAVHDEGPGLTPEEQKRIWERFYQVPGRRIQGGPGGSMGLGLGLYICQTIISLHGGEIGVKSELGQGSTFYFILPLNQLANP
ncbi:hypothetical protein KSC_010560 [Ktedonobacter sp. SOSP1-52]|uniref:PAS domain-containing sensor histidine kinase n=1 Tax=Ktedonobacter sp. SOSP1-52 TaxID=2778366 RepID=UPI001915C8ED|nr:PAS domain S-box protein [Ktedonobacter sp. SOSP1-52]GHO62164.1 hypothetical protein KSC_010560 [Ktedonobacter sp. SOSP1-52]